MGRKVFRRFIDAGLLEWPCASVVVHEDRGELELRAIFSEIVRGHGQDLCLRFGRVVAVASFEEIAHPWDDDDVDVPRLSGDWRHYTYPILRVENSEWMALVRDALPAEPEVLAHFRVVTLDKTVDVLAERRPAHAWLTPNRESR
jgi:hypothetical protein